jgi:uncharacterized protein (DUF1015 family)
MRSMVIFLIRTQSKTFTIHLVTRNVESMQEYVAYITENDEPRPQTLPAAPWVKRQQ